MVHLTEKPVELAVRAMTYSSKPGENVLDLFGGSGSTLIAAEQMGRKAFLMELDPPYCDVIISRWETFVGRKAKRIVAGKPAATRSAAQVAVGATEDVTVGIGKGAVGGIIGRGDADLAACGGNDGECGWISVVQIGARGGWLRSGTPCRWPSRSRRYRNCCLKAGPPPGWPSPMASSSWCWKARSPR